MPYNYAAKSFHTKKLSVKKIHFYTKNGHLSFLSTLLRSLGEPYAVYIRLIGKPVVDFLWVIIELSSLDIAAEALRATVNRQSLVARAQKR